MKHSIAIPFLFIVLCSCFFISSVNSAKPSGVLIDQITVEGLVNGQLPPGQTATIHVPVENTGDNQEGVMLNVAADSGIVSFPSSVVSIPDLPLGATQTCNFTIMNSGTNMVGGQAVTLTFTLTNSSGDLLSTTTYGVTVGQSVSEGIPLWIIGILALVIIVAIVGVVMYKKRSKTSLPSTQLPTPTPK